MAFKTKRAMGFLHPWPFALLAQSYARVQASKEEEVKIAHRLFHHIEH